MVATAARGQGERSADKNVKRVIHAVAIMLTPWGIEVRKLMKSCHMNICCMQELRWRGESSRKIARRNLYFKFFWKENNFGTGGVGVLVADKWFEKVTLVVKRGTR